jgi:hypothetical protein
VFVTEFGQPIVTTPSIRPHRAAWFNHIPNRRLEAFARGVTHLMQADSSYSLFGLFHRKDHQSLPYSSPTTLSGTDAPDENLIDFGAPGESITTWPDHSPPKFM